jgi:hypothetical protein
MNKLAAALVPLLVVAASLAPPSYADDEEEAMRKDLTAVIALHGLPCGQVVAVKVLAKDDYAATCKDKNKYRVYLNAAGRVIVDKQE